MARLLQADSTQYLECSSAVVTAPPLTMAVWFRAADTERDHYLICISDRDANTMLFALVAAGASAVTPPDPILAISRSPADGSHYAASTTAFGANVWHHGCGVIASAGSRAAYIDGGSKGTNTDAVTVYGLDTTSIGRIARPAPAGYANATVGFPAIWNAALTDDEVAMLAKGVWPPLIRPDNLVAFWPLMGASPEPDIVGGYGMTPYNGPTVTDNPRILMPPRRSRVYYSIPSGILRRVYLTGGMHDLTGGLGGA